MSLTLATVDKALSGQLKDSFTRNLIRVILVIYILMISSLHLRSTVCGPLLKFLYSSFLHSSIILK